VTIVGPETIPSRFAEVAAARPSAIAIGAGLDHVSYADLDRRSDALGTAILRRAPSGQAPVGVLLADPDRAAAALLGTWKAGRLCVPLDPDQPPARIEAILDDAGAGLVLTDGAGGPALRIDRSRRLGVEDVDLAAAADLPRAALGPDSPAYLLYTSGSTGVPKAVVQTHGNALHRARWAIASCAVGPGDRVSGLHAPAFAAGLRDLLTAVLGGATLVPCDLRRAGPAGLARWVVSERITILCAVVTVFRHLLDGLAPGVRVPSVRVVRLGAEPLHRRDVEGFREHFAEGCRLVAGYGASEASGIAEYEVRADAPLPAGRVPAGYAVAGVEILVLDERGRPVATGESGEIAVRSRHLSPGYWRRPDLTRAAFRTGPDGRERVYHTGDVGRLRADGCLEVLGRRDHEVKIRGHRVHPAEVERALAEHPEIREAAVVPRPDARGEVRLVACVVPVAPPGPSARALRQFLRARLPAFMLPSAVVPVEALPVTASGKIDRGALPAPAEPGPAPPGAAPLRTPLEHQVAEIWERLLGVPGIGASDDFFDLGGDSLRAAAFAAILEETCGRSLAPSALLEAPTVAGVAAALARVDATPPGAVIPLRASGTRPPLVFLHGDFTGGGLYCHALCRLLDPDRPFYAVHPHGMAGGAVPRTIEAMAEERLQAVRADRPRGPYALGGHCNGGLVALEMARRLLEQGERVEVVVLVESRAPGRSLRACVERALAGAAWQLRERTRALRGRLRRDAAAVAAEVGGAIRSYAPPPYPGRVVLFRAAAERPARRVHLGGLRPERRPDLGWRAIAPGLEIVEVPGDHVTCITRHVAVLAARLDEVLRGPAGTPCAAVAVAVEAAP
jgi:amino acid adenylation domain-containing protein